MLKFFFEKWDIICLQMLCLSNFAQTHVRDIGLKFAGDCRSPFLNISNIFTGQKILLRKGDISLAAFFRIRFGSSSGPGAFPPFKPLSNLITPRTVISNLGISVFGGPGSLGIFVVSSEVKTEQKWLFNISALRLLSECSWPFAFKGKAPFPSWRCDLI